jgi:hypothetical protein
VPVDLLTTYTQYLELQAITAPSLISTIRTSTQLPLFLFPACSFQQPFPSNGFLTVDIFQLLCSRRYCTASIPQLITCQPSSQCSTELPTLNKLSLTNQLLHYTQPAWGTRYIASGRTQQKAPPPTVPLLSLAVA